jgi:hypothetical protein
VRTGFGGVATPGDSVLPLPGLLIIISGTLIMFGADAPECLRKA